jgi:Na+/H+ antiporter NhaD/arsenite permease-like protein
MIEQLELLDIDIDVLRMVISAAIFIGCLILIFSEKINRTIAAFLGASLIIILGKLLHFYDENLAVEAIDFNTLGLLFGMMILVALLEPTGFFQYLAVWVGRLSQGRPVRLLILIGSVTTVLSMFLDNVTTVVLIAPVTILICEILGISPLPYLMSEAILSNTGGISTMVGDPPNILIASAANFSFNDFLVHSFPLILIVWFVTLGVLRFLFRKDLRLAPPNADALFNLHPSEALKDRKSAKRVLIVIGFAVIGFLLEEVLHASPSLIAISAAAAALVWVRPDIQKTLKLIEWDILTFFGALFIMVGGMEHAGLLDYFAEIILQGINLPPLVFYLLILWVVAILSAIVDNIPITIALIPVIQGLGRSGIDVNPIWWALAFGAGLGGNGTIIGSTANFVVTSLSERTRTPITPRMWSKKGLPVMFATLIVMSILYAGVTLTFGWG